MLVLLLKTPEFDKQIAQGLGLTTEGETDIKVTVISQKDGSAGSEFVSFVSRKRRPCPPWPCCWG